MLEDDAEGDGVCGELAGNPVRAVSGTVDDDRDLNRSSKLGVLEQLRLKGG
jgi:hypothetical protein